MIAEPKSRLQLIFGVFFLAIGCIGVIGGWGAYFRDTEIVRDGKLVEAHVSKKYVMRDAESGNEYKVNYWFDLPDGRRIHSSSELPKRTWNQLTIGAPLKVVYSVENPKRSFPEGGGVTSFGLMIFATVLFGALASLGAMLTVGYIRTDNVKA
jgi:hypothetical protein